MTMNSRQHARVHNTLGHLVPHAHHPARASASATRAGSASTALSALKVPFSERDGNPYDAPFLRRNRANYVPLTPITLLEHTAEVYGHRKALVQDHIEMTWAETFADCRRIASSLSQLGLGRGHTVGIFSPNTIAMYCCFFGVPMSGATICLLNSRLDDKGVAFILQHSESKAIFVDRELSPIVHRALAILSAEGHPLPLVIDIDDPCGVRNGPPCGQIEYRALLAQGDPNFAWVRPKDEFDPYYLAYTSGTTGNPKGVIGNHRSFYLIAFDQTKLWNLPKFPVYLWSLPMFHAGGWGYPVVTALNAAVNVIQRYVRAKPVFDAIVKHKVTHMCGAPTVVATLAHAPAQEKRRFSHVKAVKIMVGGAPPPAAHIKNAEEAGFEICHVYGLTECSGPAVMCFEQDAWKTLPKEQQYVEKSAQGVRYTTQDRVIVCNPETMQEVPHDGRTQGEIMMRGNLNMIGYLKNESATRAAFEHGYFHTGDIAVVKPNGYIKITDRSKDVIISGGENISSIEVQDTIVKHPKVAACAVVGAPHERWGETPCAFVELRPGESLTEPEVIEFCRQSLARYKCPTKVIFGPLAYSPTGKVQKFKLRAQVGGGKVFH